MTAEEAIERINEHIAIHRYNEPQAIRIAEALQMAIEALEKQIQKKAQKDLQPTCNNLATDCISRHAAIDAIANCTNCGDEKTLRAYVQKHNLDNGWTGVVLEAIDAIEDLPSAQSDIIRCNACKHWTQTTGNMPGFGLGDCDYLNAKLVSCNGFCYWAERRTDE